ncbi:MAG: GMC oxidoreductase, partial [Actinomycetes bacterium]
MVRRSTVAVVGSGPAGVTLALELANRGVDVLILEGGGLEEDTTQQDLVAAGEIDLNRHAPLTMTHLRQVGGTSNIWGGRSLPFDPWDFEVRSVTGAARWPISYEEIASYIPTACSWLDCGRNVFTARDVPTMPTTMFPGLPDDEVSTSTLERWSLPLSFKQSYLADLKANRRIRLVHGLTCTQIETDGASGRAVALRCRNLVGGEARIEADTFVVAAGGIESTRLLLSSIGPSGSALGDESGHLGRWYQAHVQGVAADIHFARSPGAAIDYVRDVDGSFVRRRFAFTEEFQRAEGLPNIVAWVDNPEVADAEHDCGELSTVYLALKSPLGPMVAGEAQRLSITGTFIPGTPYGGADASPPLDHLRNIARHPVRTARFMAGFGSMRLLSRGRKAPGFMVHNDREVYPFEYHGEQRPNRDSRIWLTDEHDSLGMRRVGIDLRFTDDDVDGAIRAHEHWDRYLRVNGIGHLEYLGGGVREAIERRLGGGFHQVGSTRMSASPEDGVVDANLRIHSTKNVFVASSSTFVTSSHANPTLMIVA